MLANRRAPGQVYHSSSSFSETTTRQKVADFYFRLNFRKLYMA